MERNQLIQEAARLFRQLESLEEEERIDTINAIRLALHAHSPLKQHPVDCVLWVKQDEVQANSYNPNVVPPAEMKLLKTSIMENGFTQPAVTWIEEDGTHEIIDGHHRWLTSQEKEVCKSVKGRLPITVANPEKTGRADRIAATIEHNRARGEHSTELMQALVQEVIEIGMSDAWVMKKFGMDSDELLRLKALTGLAALFADKEFSRSWVAEEMEEINE